MSAIPIALELYSVRHNLQEDLHGTLKAVADMGYAGVEFAGSPQHTAVELKPILDDLGLVCCSWHTPIDLVKDDKFATTVEFNRILGNRSIIIPGLPKECTESKDAWLKSAAFFNELSEKLALEGMFAGYHNHWTEWTPLDGVIPWDIFFGNTRNEVVMQLDTGNALRGGAESVPILERYPGRARSVHLKPFRQVAAGEDPNTGFRPMIGEDDIPWKQVFSLCETTGNTEWYIVEYESDAFPPLEAVDRCLKALKAMGQ